MPGKHPLLETMDKEARPQSDAPMNARYQPCKVCGQVFDHLEPMLAGYHSTTEHKPISDGQGA